MISEGEKRSLQDAIYLEKVRRAKALSIGQRLASGPELFEEAVSRMKIGIRLNHPKADEEAINRLLKKQLNRLQAWKEGNLYRPVTAGE